MSTNEVVSMPELRGWVDELGKSVGF